MTRRSTGKSSVMTESLRLRYYLLDNSAEGKESFIHKRMQTTDAQESGALHSSDHVSILHTFSYLKRKPPSSSSLHQAYLRPCAKVTQSNNTVKMKMRAITKVSVVRPRSRMYAGSIYRDTVFETCYCASNSPDKLLNAPQQVQNAIHSAKCIPSSSNLRYTGTCRLQVL
ncbi:hypothetical protein GYMLUDRAFT_788821 [Collybiopsis luxurians FD-317 M1]|nr:hypothetical protein GYMLUDRAFT_788821 [Collybiopsis luxurians FD-317 M1]